MESPLNAVGFSKSSNKYDTEDIIEGILNNPSKQMAIELTPEVIFAEYLQELAENTYLIVRVTVKKDNDSDKDPEITVYNCDAFVEAENNMQIEELSIERGDEYDEEDTDYYVIFEEKESSMEIIFILQNTVQYLEGVRQGKTIKEVNVVGIASEGTIILPIEKDEEEERVEKEEREKLRSILQKMKEGDEEARSLLEKEEKELDLLLKERLREEDFLTVMSGYFMPATVEDSVYAILGEILAIKERKNKITDEEMYVLTLDVNDLILEVVIHKDELIGMPSVGMRFMGTCWIQGQVIME
ncbi:DUF3881 family protein [Niameybacter massiliensis]|uniref:DUF3881 family protein n=1 Tax=Holtiella tumoricola TaxID=3018743 RepID=A0AA42IZY8_9FIRM|nr:DUF3881 family protein [Holtiella tumoricola]MDA3730548.1 DUF3881 family protein [Holtiella tumoricola]